MEVHRDAAISPPARAPRPAFLSKVRTPGPEDLVRGAEAAIILPTLNEEGGLRRTLEELPAALERSPLSRVQPVVIDGGSTDGTLALAQKAGLPVFRQRTTGKGAAVIEAFQRVTELGVRYAVVLDADATYPPDSIAPALTLLSEGTDLVLGIRNPIWGAPKDFKDLVHRVGNVLLSYSASLLTHRTILDLCSGFWGISTQRFSQLDLSSTTFAVEAELVLKAIREGYSVRQIPIDYRERIGVAKLRTIRDGFRIFLTIVHHGRRVGELPVPTVSYGGSIPDLLSIGVISGAVSTVVEADPSRLTEALRLARALRGKLQDAHVVVETPADRSPPSGPVPANGATPAKPLHISLPSAVNPTEPARSVTVSIRTERRQLTIDLPGKSSAALPLVLDGPEEAFARSGGVMTRRGGPGASSREVLRSRIDFDPLRRTATLLGANGFHATVVDQPEPLIPPSTEAPVAAGGRRPSAP